MTTYLLDANVLIALVVEEHEHHDRVATWLNGVERFALCPVVEGALVRFLVRMGEAPSVADGVLAALHAAPACEVWLDAISYVDVDLSHVRGHRQVTDAYLASLARTHGDAVLATLDQGVVADLPELTLLVPSTHP